MERHGQLNRAPVMLAVRLAEVRVSNCQDGFEMFCAFTLLVDGRGDRSSRLHIRCLCSTVFLSLRNVRLLLCSVLHARARGREAYFWVPGCRLGASESEGRRERGQSLRKDQQPTPFRPTR